MAKRLRIADIDQGTTVDLLAGTLKMEDGSWQTRHAGDRTIETFNLMADDTDSNIITGEAALSNALYEAKRWHRDPLLGASYWLEANATSESARRSLLYDGLLQTRTRGPINPLLGAAGGEAFFSLALTRAPWWENVSASTASTTSVATIGGKWTLADNGGTQDGRIGLLDIDGRAGILTRFWIGIRPTYYGITNYDTLWECESGTLGTDTSSTADATCSGGNKARCSFSTTATMANRVTLVIGNSSTPEHMIGRYLVLLRGNVTSGTVGIQMKTGYSGISTFAEHREVFLSDTNEAFIELGEIQIPGQGYRDLLQGSTNVQNYTLIIAAERISGSGSLDMDAIVLIPTEHFLYLDEVSVSKPGISWPTEVYTNENDEVSTLSKTVSSIPNLSGIINATNWRYPKDGGVLVLAAQGSTTQTITDTVDLNYQVFPRWRHWRG